MEWKNIYRGIAMGASDLIPGVSGGTIAVLLGIYDQLIASINGIFSKDWKEQLRFLIPLGIGIAIALLSLSHVIKWLLKYHTVPTYFFFLGLIIGVLPYLFHKAEAKSNFTMKHIILLLIGIIVIGSLFFFKDPDQGSAIVNKTMSTYILLFLSGFIASAAMILPGISGSFVFLIIGVFPTIIDALTNLHIAVILVTGAGIFIGIVSMSKLIHFFLTKYRTSTFSVIIGSVIGSIFVIFPGWPLNVQLLLLCIATFATGLIAAYVLGKVEYEEQT